jgi:hypothetical protein
MGWPIVIVASGGIPVTESANGFGTPVEVAANGYGTPVTVVASGGLPVLGTGGGDAIATFFAGIAEANKMWLDFDRLDTEFQQSTGLTPVSATTQSVGLWLGRESWGSKTLTEVLAGQPELRAAGAGTTTGGWTESGGIVTAPGTAVSGDVTFPLTGATVVGRLYRISIPNTMSKNGFYANFGSGTGSQVGGLSSDFSSVILTCTAPGTVIRVGRWSGAVPGSIGPLSVKEIPSNHGAQTTANSRPRLHSTGLRGDGSDDSLLTSLAPDATLNTWLFDLSAGAGAENDVVFGSSVSDRLNLSLTGSGAPNVAYGTNANLIIDSTIDLRGQSAVLVVVTDATHVHLYRDGSLVGSASRSGQGSIGTGRSLSLFAATNNSTGALTSQFAGDIRRVRIAKGKAATAAEVAAMTAQIKAMPATL